MPSSFKINIAMARLTLNSFAPIGVYHRSFIWMSLYNLWQSADLFSKMCNVRQRMFNGHAADDGWPSAMVTEMCNTSLKQLRHPLSVSGTCPWLSRVRKNCSPSKTVGDTFPDPDETRTRGMYAVRSHSLLRKTHIAYTNTSCRRSSCVILLAKW